MQKEKIPAIKMINSNYETFQPTTISKLSEKLLPTACGKFKFYIEAKAGWSLFVSIG